MGPSLRSWEFDAWARSRKLAPADAEQLRAVFEERDRLKKALEEVLVDARILADARKPWESARSFASITVADALLMEICP